MGKALILAIMAVLIVLIFAPQSYFDRMKTMKSYQSDGSAQGRIDAWKASIRMAIDHPLLGVGPGNFTPMYISRYRPEGSDIGIGSFFTAAHSLYFQTLAELGFPGLFVVVAIIFSNILSNRRVKKKIMPNSREDELLTYFTMSWVGYAVTAAFLTVLYYPHIFVLSALNVLARNNILGEKETLSDIRC